MHSVGRNDRCLCGSGRKYKRCCLAKDDASHLDAPSKAQISRGLSSSERLLEGFEFPSFPHLGRLTVQNLKKIYLAGYAWQSASTLLADHFDGEKGFEACRLSSGELSFAFRYPRSGGGTFFGNDRNEPLSVIQETSSNDVLLGACSCEVGQLQQFCPHLYASFFALWSLLRREYPIVWSSEAAEARLDAFLQRPPRVDEQANIEFQAIHLCPILDDSPFPTLKNGAFLMLPPMKREAFYDIERKISTFRYLDPMVFDEPISYLLRRKPITGPGRYVRDVENQMALSLQYQFSNGTLLSVGELIRHPLLKKVPKNFLPLDLEKGVSTQSSIPIWATFLTEKTSSWSTHEFNVSSRAVLQVAERALKASTPVYLLETADRSKKRKALKISSIGLDPRSPQWAFRLGPQLNEAHVEFVGNSKEAWRLEGDQFILCPSPYAFRLLPDSQANLLAGQENIRQGLDFLQSKLQQIGLPQVLLPETLAVPQEQIRFEVWMNADGDFQFSYSISAQKVRILDFSPICQRWLQIIQNGVGASSKTDPKEIALSRRGAKRDLDLKILRHCGFAAVLFWETSSFALQGASSTGEKFENFKEFLKWLKLRLGALAFEISGKAELLSSAAVLEKYDICDLCSKRVADLIVGLITEIHTALSFPNEETVFLLEKIIRVQGTAKAFARLFNTLISIAAQATKGACFLKSRTPAILPLKSENGRFENFSWVAQSLSDLTENSPISPVVYKPLGDTRVRPMVTFQALFALNEHGFDLFWNGQPTDFFGEDDLKAVFDVKTTSTSVGQQKSLDWFELHPTVFLKGREVSREELGKISRSGLLEHQGKIYLIREKNLPSIQRLAAFWERLQAGKSDEAISAFGAEAGGIYRKLPPSETLEFLALESQLGAQVRGNSPKWKEVRDFYHSLDQPRPPITLPSTIKAVLKPYQFTGVQWMLDLHRLRLGGILADEMGLGKTIQTLAFLEILRSEQRLGHTLIVVPTSLSWNWKRESERFTPELPIRNFDPKDKVRLETELETQDPIVLIVTYGLLTEHSEWFLSQANGPRKWDIALFDEAQNLKNILSRRSDTARGLNANYKFCLTGTPLENHVGELYSLLDLVVPGCMGNYLDFRARFEQLSDPSASAQEFAFLRRKIRPLLLRRQKSQILKELPAKTETRVDLPLETLQRKIYRDIALSWNTQVQESLSTLGEAKSQLMMLTALLRLRQACSNPASLPNVKYNRIPPKIELLGESLPEILDSNESVLVFTQFLGTMECLKSHLMTLGIPSLCIHGGVSRKEREKILGEFQDAASNAKVLIMTLKTGGVGLNLTRASYVFHLEPWWNPAVENQATDRAHRIGQERPVQVYRYVMKDTVEEKIETLKARKSAIFEAAINSSGSAAVLSERPDLDLGAEDGKDSRAGLKGLSRSDFELLLDFSAASSK